MALNLQSHRQQLKQKHIGSVFSTILLYQVLPFFILLYILVYEIFIRGEQEREIEDKVKTAYLIKKQEFEAKISKLDKNKLQSLKYIKKQIHIHQTLGVLRSLSSFMPRNSVISSYSFEEKNKKVIVDIKINQNKLKEFMVNIKNSHYISSFKITEQSLNQITKDIKLVILLKPIVEFGL